MRIRLTLLSVAATIVGVALLFFSSVGAQGPLTPAPNLAVRTDANGYLLTSAASYTASDGPLTVFGNIRLRTDSSGYLLITQGAIGTTGLLSAQGANIGTTNIPGDSSVASGLYEVCGWTAITRAATTSATLPSIVIGSTNGVGSFAATLIAASSTNSVNAGGGACSAVRASAASAITYSTASYASSGVTSMQYELYVTSRPIY